MRLLDPPYSRCLVEASDDQVERAERATFDAHLGIAQIGVGAAAVGDAPDLAVGQFDLLVCFPACESAIDLAVDGLAQAQTERLDEQLLGAGFDVTGNQRRDALPARDGHCALGVFGGNE